MRAFPRPVAGDSFFDSEDSCPAFGFEIVEVGGEGFVEREDTIADQGLPVDVVFDVLSFFGESGKDQGSVDSVVCPADVARVPGREAKGVVICGDDLGSNIGGVADSGLELPVGERGLGGDGFLVIEEVFR